MVGLFLHRCFFKMMIDEKTFNKITSIVLMSVLIILSFVILRPILVSSLFALILSFIFYPVYKKLNKITGSRNLSAFLVCFGLLVVIIAPLVVFVPIFVRQIVSVFSFVQGEEFLSVINNLFSGFFPEELSREFIVYLNNFTSYLTNTLLKKAESIILSSPVLFLHSVIILFLFFFGLRDGEKIILYIQSLSPLSKESEKKVFKQFKDITHSVIYGQIVIGVIQGVLTGIILFIFRIPNALVLTILAMFLGVLPIIGPSLIWIPLVFYLFAVGRVVPAFVMLIFGFFVISGIDNLLRPLIVGKKTKINSGVILVSMIGGLLVFGVLGLIIGPLIISYLLLVLEPYRKGNNQSIFIHNG